jgi:hypothetical protein
MLAIVKKEPMTATQIVTNNSKKASNTVSNCQICKCSFSTKIGTGKLGRISTENLSQTSNCEGSRATALALMCASVAIVINKLSHLSDHVCNSCWRRKVRNLFQLFHLVKNSTKEESVQSSDHFVSNGQLASSVSLSQRSPANRKLFQIGLHASASKSSPQKALFSSVQEQSQHQPKDNFLEEHITYQVCLKLMKLK